MNVMPVAEELASAVLGGRQDSRLKWDGQDHVRLLMGEVLPVGSAVKETLGGRRKRLREALAAILATAGWRMVRANVFASRTDDQQGSGRFFSATFQEKQMDEQRWYSREHRVRSLDGIDLHVAVEPMKASDRMGNRATKSGNEKTAKLTLSFNEHWSGGFFGDDYVFECVPISSLMDLQDALAQFFARPAIRDEVDRILLLRRIATPNKGPNTAAEQDQ